MDKTSVNNNKASINQVVSVVPIALLVNLISTRAPYRKKLNNLSDVNSNKKHVKASSFKHRNGNSDDKRRFKATEFVLQKASTPH
jgi:hypothetical protein